MIGNGSKDKEPKKPEIMEKPSKRKEKSLIEMHQKKLHKKKKVIYFYLHVFMINY